MDPISTLNQGVPSSAAQIPYYDPANGQGRKASIGALAEVVGLMLATPGAIPGASLVLTADGLPSDDTGYDGWLAADPNTGALYLKVNGSWVVKDAGNAPSALAVTGSPVLAGTVGQNYAGFLVVASGGVTPYTYSDPAGSLPAGLTIHPSIGLVHGSPTQAGASGLVALLATDATGAQAILAPFSIDIVAAGSALALFGNPLTSATVGSAYSFALSATGGTAPYTYAVVSGTLPAGVTLNTSTGVVSGTPTTVGTVAGITLGVTDSDGTQVSLAAFSVTVSAAVAVLSISGTPSTSAVIGVAYSFTPVATGGTAPRTFALIAGTLPAGLSFNTSTGAITGTPTTAGSAAGLTIRVTDAVAATATLAAFTLTVTADAGIGGITIGDAGTGVLAGFKLAAGDDFNAAPTRWHGRNLTGRYAHSALSFGFRRTNDATDHMMYIDPAFRGSRSQSPTDLGYDGTAVADSVLTLTASAPPSELLPFLPTNYGARGDGFGRPRLISGSLKTSPSYMISMQADGAWECLVKVAGGQARGYWPSFWTTSFFWPDFGEIDILEAKKTDSSGAVTTTLNNVIVSATDGASQSSETVATPVIPTDRYVRLLCKKEGGTVYFYDDADVAGTLALRGSTTTRVSRLRGAHDIRIDLAVASAWDSTSQNMADWPQIVEFDWWRAWVPAAAGDNTDLQVLTAVNTTPGGSWAATLPARTTLFGTKAGLEQVCAAWDNMDAPGVPTRNSSTRLPTSMTVNLTSRAVSGTVPSTEGGRMGVLLTYAYDDGTPAGRAILPYNVAPAIQALFDSSVVEPGTAISLSIPYTAFHSGNLGPHTYNVTAPGLTVTGNGTGSVTIAGTAGADGTASTITVNVTNSIGQVTTVVRTVTATASGGGFNPATWTEVLDWWDADDNTKVFSDSVGTTAAVAGTSKAARLVGLKAAIPLTNAGSLTVPTYVTDANTRKCIRFTASETQRLVSADAAIGTLVSGNDLPYAVIMSAKRGPAGVSVTPFALCRNDAGSVVDLVRHFFSGSDTIGVTRTAAGAATTAASTGTAVGANQWYTVAWLVTGTTLTIRLNGTTIATDLALNTASLTLMDLVLGCTYGNGSDTFDSATAFNGHIGEFGLLSAVTAGDSTLAAAEAYLMAKWTN